MLNASKVYCNDVYGAQTDWDYIKVVLHSLPHAVSTISITMYMK